MNILNKLVLSVFVLSFLMITNISQAQVAIIANKNIDAASINVNTLNNLFTLQSNEIGSKKVKIFFSKDENDTTGKLLSSMGKSLGELKKIWLKAKLTGNGNPPEMISGENNMIDKIASTPDAVGFVSLNAVNDKVKIIYKIE